MLDPHVRHLLVDSLRPPDRFALDAAIATTYSLDLLALLTAPLSFTFFSWDDPDSVTEQNPLALLESIRRLGDRITVFNQAAEIHVPPRREILFAYLEDCVYPVLPDQGVFHAKLWILRFTGMDEIRYRVIVPSRNLTFDSSWDTLLILEGQYNEGRTRGYSRNQALADLLGTLPTISTRPLTEQRSTTLLVVADEIRRTPFNVPEPFNEYRIWGFPTNRRVASPVEEISGRLLVCSPFMTAGTLNRLCSDRTDATLISRSEELEGLPASVIQRFSKVFVLVDEATPEPIAESDTGDAMNTTSLSGLHAKLFIAEAGRLAHVFTGSANATDAAFTANHEILVELIGSKSKVGIDALLKSNDGQTTFADLLGDYHHSDSEDSNEDAITCEQSIAQTKRQIAAGRLFVRVGTDPNESGFELALVGAIGKMPDHVKAVTAWPVTLREENAVTITEKTGAIVHFGTHSLEAITPFVAFRVTASSGTATRTGSFVVRLPLEGAPDDRLERYLRILIKDTAGFLRLLMLILRDWTSASWLMGDPDSTSDLPVTGFGEAGGGTLLETMLEALDREPGKLDRIAKLMEELQRDDGIDDVLPQSFLNIWEAVAGFRGEDAR